LGVRGGAVLCVPAGEEVQLLVGGAVGLGGAGNEGEVLAGDFECVSGEFDVADELVT